VDQLSSCTCDGSNFCLSIQIYKQNGYLFQERRAKVIEDITNLDIPGELAFVYDKLDRKYHEFIIACFNGMLYK